MKPLSMGGTFPVTTTVLFMVDSVFVETTTVYRYIETEYDSLNIYKINQMDFKQ